MSNQTFQILKELPTPLYQTQCVLHKHEILICGGRFKRACYSYHTLKNEYKFICDYPSHVKLNGHCVVKLDNNNKNSNQITLLSFGGSEHVKRHTLVMKYISWVPFTDNHNNPIIILRDNIDFQGARAVIGGSNSHLLFITYLYKNISVFDLNTLQFIKHDTLQFRDYCQIWYHCFVSKSENIQGQEMMKTNQGKSKQNQMLLFKQNIGLSIEYDEDNNTFQFHQLPVCKDIEPFSHYAYVCVNDVILFFGGWNYINNATSKLVRKYSIQENKWTTFQNILHSRLYDCTAILSEEDNIHIIGGMDDKDRKLSTHINTKVRVCDPSQLSKNDIKCIIQYWNRTLEIRFGWIDDFDKITVKSKIKIFVNNSIFKYGFDFDFS
ncbi:hypothetical protein RFI_00127 [Reticulomyxa filosa]|uniref:Kelch motif family protein n=1 Tax=Reticulomyxa filosa TaxID=46433 RepID=X6PFY8_RETFI|nr:hypothetical protein RFI_00127 [Reticulomyxa filosa]|eukprot:ETO36934.1 hypothetical protein RFI_00127 [Reticulomyxa filosa]